MPIVFLWIICLNSAIEIFLIGIDNSGGIEWLWPVGIAWLVTTLVIIVFFVKRNWFKYAVIFILIIGILGIIRFTVAKTSYQFNSSIKLESTSLLFILLYILINLKRIFSTKTKQPIAIKQNEEKIEGLKEKYLNRTSEELKTIIIDSRYGEEAKMAANEILKDRENKSKL